MHLGAPARTRQELRRFAERLWSADELANAARTHHVVAMERERVPDSLLQRRQIRRRILVEEVDPKARRQPAFLMQRQEGQWHRVVVLVRRAVARGVGRLEAALVEMSGDAQAQAVRQRVDRAALALLRVEQRLPQDERGPTGPHGPRADRAVFANGYRRGLA